MRGVPITLSGTHLEIGNQIGELYKSWGKKEVYIPKYADTYFKQQLDTYTKHYPEYLEYLEGISQSMNISKDLVIKSYLTGFLSLAHKKPKKCSVFATHSNGKTYVGRNYDWLTSSEVNSKLLKYTFNDKSSFDFTGISDMGTWQPHKSVKSADFIILIEDAWNSQGLFVCLNGAPETKGQAGLATPHIVQLLVEKCKTTEEALNLLEKADLDQPKIFTIADRKGGLAVVEKRLESMHVTESTKQVFATNHYQHKNIKHLNKSIFEKVPFHSTFGRREYLRANVSSTKIDSLEDVEDIISKPPVIQNWRDADTVTCWTNALDLTKGKYQTTVGPLTKDPKNYSN